MYAIKNIRTGKWLYGTDHRRYPPIQRTSFEQVATFDDKEYALSEFNRRKCGKDYRVIKIQIIEVKEE